MRLGGVIGSCEAQKKIEELLNGGDNAIDNTGTYVASVVDDEVLVAPLAVTQLSRKNTNEKMAPTNGTLLVSLT